MRVGLKKAEHWRIDAFELWYWKRLLRVPWTARRSTQSILKETSPGYSSKDWCWSRISNTLAMWCEELTPWKGYEHIKKQRHYFAKKGPSSQNYGFSISHYGYESWTIKKAECRRIDAFELWCWRRFLRVPWPARRSTQSILKETSPE